MFKLSIKNALAHKRRLLGTALSVIIGIAFLSGTYVFTDTIGRTFDNLFASVFENTDAYVRSSSSIDTGFGGKTYDRLPDTKIAEVAAVPGVKEADGVVQGYARIIGSNGKPIGSDNGPPTFGAAIGTGSLSSWKISDGRVPSGPEQAAIDAASARNGKLKVGDKVKVIAQSGTREFDLVGIAQFGGSADSPGGATFALFDLPTAQDFVIGKPGLVDSVIVRGDGSLNQEQLAERLQQSLGSGTEVLTGAEITKETQKDIQNGLKFFNILLTVFAAIALFVSIFIIYNTFAIIVAQRQKETALLRAIGASRGQVVGSVLIESVIIGLVASILGFLGGIVMAQVLKAGLAAGGIDLPAGALVLKPRTAIVSLVVGLFVTVVAAVLPSLQASRVPPIAAMRDVAIDRSATSRSRFLIGLVVSAIGAGALVAGLFGAGVGLLAVGIPLLFIGVFVLGPLIARPVAGALGAPLPALRGMPGRLARENAMRNPKRTARTAAALMVGVALVAGISVLASSVKASIRSIIGEQFTGDFVVTTASQGGAFGGLPPELAGKLAALPEVKAATGIQLGIANVNGNGEFLSVIEPATLGKVFDLNFVEGSVEALTDDGILLSKSQAADDAKKVGDPYDITFIDGKARTLKVEGIYEKDELAGARTVSKGLYATTGADQFDFSIYGLKADGVSNEAALAAMEPVVKDYPTAKLQTRDQYISDQAKSIDQFVNLIYGLLALSVIIAVFGIANTLSLSVYERTREIGLLRAVGMTRGQTRSTIRWESVITSLLGTAQGIVIGLFLGYAVIVALRDQGLDKFSIPVTALVVVVILAVAIGIIAAIGPARRASKLDVLHAISTE